MASKPAPSKPKPSAAPPGGAWDEQHLQDSFDHLNLLHIKLRELRTTIPRMLAPLSDKQSTPEALYQSFSQSVNVSHQEVGDFTKLRKDPQTTEALDYAARRRKEEPAGIKPWNGKRDPNWTVAESS